MIENYLDDYTENYRKYDRLFENKREIDIYVRKSQKFVDMGYSWDQEQSNQKDFIEVFSLSQRQEKEGPEMRNAFQAPLFIDPLRGL